MFVLLLTYVRPLEEVDALMRDHMAWIRKQYEAGHFVVSGRRVPRTGGVIVARGDDREAIEALAANDPFVIGGVATCEVVQFQASQTAAGLDALLYTSSRCGPSNRTRLRNREQSGGRLDGRLASDGLRQSWRRT